MKKLIHKYLSEFYYIKKNSIYSKLTDVNKGPSFTVIKSEIIKIFGLTEKKLKWYVKSWVRKQNRGIDFNMYWKPPTMVKIKATWTSEMADDISQYHGININLELISTLELELNKIMGISASRLGQ